MKNMRKLSVADLSALFSVATYDCMKDTNDCSDCPYFANVVNDLEELDCGCISIYLKHILDKYYTNMRGEQDD